MEAESTKRKTTTITIGPDTAEMLRELVEDATHDHAKTLRAQAEIAIMQAHNKMVRLRER